NTAIKLDSGMAWAYEGRGTVNMCQSKFELAIADLTKAVELDSKLLTAYMNRGLAQVLAGNDTAAESDFKRALEINPSYREDLNRRIAKAKALREELPR